MLTACATSPAPDLPPESDREPAARPRAAFADRLDAYLDDVVARFEIPGLAVCVVQDDQVTYVRALGTRNLDTGEPLEAEHLFHMASVSKPFVATAIMQLAERGALRLEDRVVDHLPYFALSGGPYASITVRQMLDHTSGMPDVEDYAWDDPQTDVGEAEAYVRALKSEALIGTPGEQYAYSNRAFDTLGDLIAKVSGQSFEDYMRTHIFEPLGMRQSTFFYPETPHELRTTPHTWDLDAKVSPVYPYNRRHAPSSTLNSSVLELADWARANLNAGTWNGAQILKPESHRRLWQPSFDLDDGEAVGLSWFLIRHRDRPAVHHSGGDTGYSSQLTLLPEERIAVILASNYDRTPAGTIRVGVLDIVLGLEPEVALRSMAYPFAKVYGAEGIEAAKAYYAHLVETAGESHRIDASQLPRLARFLLWNDRPQQAIEVLDFNLEVYPTSAETHRLLGQAWQARGETGRAAEHYGASLELEPDDDETLAALQALGSGEP